MTFARPLLALLLLSTASVATAAERLPVDQRVDRIERELRAVQRKVFPGGTPAFTDPEIAAIPAANIAGTPATAPLADLTARVDALEKELARMTGSVEEVQNRLRILSEQSARDRGDFDRRLKIVEAAPVRAVPASAPTMSELEGEPAPAPPRTRPGRPAAEPRPAAVEPAAKPPATSGDPGEDAYMAGYRLWTEKKYADAETQLAKTVKQYPRHKRTTYARNLLGRAQLDGGKPATAAQTFLANYQADPRGERAPDSLFYLGQALTQLKKTDNACRAYDELADVYATSMSETIKGRLPAARKAANCK